MQRLAYSQLLDWKKRKERKPLILYGVRQVGKTYLLQYFGENEFLKVHYLNFEEDPKLKKLFASDLNPTRIIQALEFYFDLSIDQQSDLLIFDEIQACPEALTSLKYFYEKMPHMAIVSAGSLLGLHLEEGSFPVGKIDLMTLYPMNFREFLLALDDTRSIEVLDQLIREKKPIPNLIHEHLWKRIKEYLIVGGLPEIVRTFKNGQENPFTAFSEVRRKQELLVHAYSADMSKHAGKVNAMHLERVWRGAVSQLAKTQDGSISRFKFKGVVPGVSHYSRLAGAIDWLSACGLIHKVHITNTARLPLSAYTKENHFKLLLFDVGILGALAKLSPQEILDQNYGSYKGYIAENFVAQELLSAGIQEFFNWQEKQAEVDYLTSINGELIPIEVKSGKVDRAKSLTLFCKKYSVTTRIIISAKPLNKNVQQGIYKLPLYLTFDLLKIINKGHK